MYVTEEFQTLQILGGVTECHSVFVVSKVFFQHVADDYVVKKKVEKFSKFGQ